MAAGSRGPADWIVRRGTVGFDLSDVMYASPWYRIGRRAFVVEISGVGRFDVREQGRITVDPGVDVIDSDIAPYLTGSILAGGLMMQGAYLLHACAVKTSVGTLLITGASGAGKSTLTAALVQRGGQLISDDTCLLTIEQGRVMVHPGAPHIKLWGESLETLGIGVRGLSRVIATEEKFYWPVRRAFVQTPQPVNALIELVPCNEVQPKFLEIAGIDKIMKLVLNGYREEYLGLIGDRKDNFTFWSMVASRISAFKLLCPRTDTNCCTAHDLAHEVTRCAYHSR